MAPSATFSTMYIILIVELEVVVAVIVSHEVDHSFSFR